MKVLKYFLSCLMILLFACPVYADTAKPGVNIQKIEKLGFTQDEISMMSDKDKATYSKLEGTVISQNTKYYKFSIDETGRRLVSEVTQAEAINGAEIANKEALQRMQDKSSQVKTSAWSGSSSCSWLSMTTTVTKLSGTKHYQFKNSFTWLSQPFIYLSDVVGITHASSISFTSGTESMYYTYDRIYQSSSQKKDTVSEYYSATKKDVGGYAWKYDLKYRDSSNTYWYWNPRGYAVVAGYATPSSFTGYSNAYGHYAHQQVTASLGIGLGFGSMTVTPSIAIDEAPDVDVQFTVN